MMIATLATLQNPLIFQKKQKQKPAPPGLELQNGGGGHGEEPSFP
jgi:hypothetical protein